MDEPILHSPITGKNYKISDMVRIVNIRQAALYIKNCVFPYHIYCDTYILESGREEQRLAFLFDKTETKWCYDLWTKGELK